MKKIVKYLHYILFLIVVFLFVGSVSAQVASTNAPTYEGNFSNYLLSGRADKDGRVANVYNIEAISANRDIETNIRCLFYPNAYAMCEHSARWWLIRSVFRYIGLGILVLFLAVVGVKFVVQPDKAKDHLMSLVYILYGAVLFFGATWILWSALDISGLRWTEWFVNAVQWWSDSIWFKIVSFLKALVFFVAIIMIVINGFKAMSAADKADKAQAAIKWIINVVVALVIVKVVDYLYFIVQSSDFVAHATSFIIEVAKIFGFIVWSLLVLMAFYAWFLFITDGGKWENMKKAVNVIKWIVMVATVIFILLLIMYQIFAEFA